MRRHGAGIVGPSRPKVWRHGDATRQKKLTQVVCEKNAVPGQSPGGATGGCPRARERQHRAFQQFMRLFASPILSLNLVLMLAVSGVCAEEFQPSEYQLKAAFLFNFAKFVEWPAGAFSEAKSPMIIGVLGDNPFGAELERTIRDKTVNGRPLQIKEYRSLSEARACHILFVSNSEKKRLAEVFEGLRGTSVLTVGETEDFIESGGMISFVRESNKIRFQINDRAARTAGLKISSKLLNLASQRAR
jgi:hypothetical protein